ncbi:PACE efflux transporter [Hansschlegelia quercus]|uniref:PACE efflux transporter n=1 Tax=Hansschlegelia quercus TaxID=2528245 RepID=A0A4Q9GSL7_9HYPH|nr:PACE efflux transporter [Hansschlegelia quercus]TBN54797.1 PACE efflux transporter [Hansschlegelia quercus]
MPPALRRLFYVLSYEALGLCVATVGLTLLSGQEAGGVSLVAVVTSTIAMAWNYVFNAGFEAWERKQTVKGRSFVRRAVHALCFEAGLVLMITPTLSWLLGVSLLEAFIYNGALIGVFLAYTFLFNLSFDRLFGLPRSARA